MKRWRRLRRAAQLLIWPLLAALVTMLVFMFVPATYTARTTIAPQLAKPSWTVQLNGRSAAPSMALYAALLQSRRLNERIVDHFGLQQVYGETTRSDTLEQLRRRVRFGSLKGLLVIEAEDRYPWRAADIARQYVIELQRLLDELRIERASAGAALLERDRLIASRQLAQAQGLLQSSGFSEATLRMDRSYMLSEQAALQQATRSAELELVKRRVGLQDRSAPMQAQQALVDALRRAQHEAQAPHQRIDTGYVDAWREVQRLEGWLRKLRLQQAAIETDTGHRDEVMAIVDRAEMPSLRSSPHTLRWMLLAWAATLTALLAWPWWRGRRRDNSHGSGRALSDHASDHTSTRSIPP